LSDSSGVEREREMMMLALIPATKTIDLCVK
jgi:hypothetical protein